MLPLFYEVITSDLLFRKVVLFVGDMEDSDLRLERLDKGILEGDVLNLGSGSENGETRCKRKALTTLKFHLGSWEGDDVISCHRK